MQKLIRSLASIILAVGVATAGETWKDGVSPDIGADQNNAYSAGTTQDFRSATILVPYGDAPTSAAAQVQWVLDHIGSGTGTYARTAGTSYYARTSGTGVYARAAGTSHWARLAGTSVYARAAGTSAYARAAGTSVYARTSGTSTWATAALYARTAGTSYWARLAGTSVYARTSGTSVWATTAGVVSDVGKLVSSIRTLYGTWTNAAWATNGHDVANMEWTTNWVATHSSPGGVGTNPKFTNRIEVGTAESTNRYHGAVISAVIVGTDNDISNGCYLTVSGDGNTVAVSTNVTILGNDNVVSNTPLVTLSGVDNFIWNEYAGTKEGLTVFGSGNRITRTEDSLIVGDSSSVDYSQHLFAFGGANEIYGLENSLVVGGQHDIVYGNGMLIVGSSHAVAPGGYYGSGPGIVVGDHCSVTGGYMSVAFGRRVNAVHEGAWVIKGDTDNNTFASDTNGQFKAKFGNGYKLQGGTTEVAAVSVKAANCNWGGFGNTNIRQVVQTITGGVVAVGLNDSGRAYVTTGKTTFNLPSVDATSLGAWYSFIAKSTNVVTIDAADTDVIDNSGTITNTYTSDNSAFKSATLLLGQAAWWHVLYGRGTWTAGTGP